MARDYILHKVRTALGRSAGQPPSQPPAARISIPEMDLETRIRTFFSSIQSVSGKTYRAADSRDARDCVVQLLGGKTAVASNSALLAECGITGISGVFTGFRSEPELRDACSTAEFGITGADYALADTGSLVMLSSAQEARMVSLLPPVHIALVEKSRLLSGLDELFTVLPEPAEATSSMVLITGPSRTADIEQFLIRGVHGPGELHVVLV
ncbi:MAG: lactate utilization protein [Acidobacteria bacterium]|nr:lactate utilization protein [Acidobacteriota bacterium]